LTGSVIVNRKNEGKKPFPTQERSNFGLAELEQWSIECIESGSATGGLKLESHEYSIQRRRAYVHSTSRGARRVDFDMEDFSISQIDLILDRADVLKRTHPKGDITVLIEVLVTWDRRAIEK